MGRWARRDAARREIDQWAGRRQQRRGNLARMLASLLGALALLLALGAALNLAVGAPTVHAAHADNGATLIILYPAPPPQSTSVSGPVGANVTVQGTAFNAGDSYQIGYALQSQGCASGFTSISSAQPVQAGSDSTLTATFSWPSTAHAIGSSYYVCAQDQTQPTAAVVQSGQTFDVVSASKPAITLAHPAPGAGTPTTNPLPDSRYYPNTQMQIDGTNFFPAGTTLQVYITSTTITQTSDLPAPTGSPFTSDGNGQFSVTITLPDAVYSSPTSFYLYVASRDGQTSGLPSLVAYKPFKIVPAPATPTPTVSPTPAATPTPANGGGNGNNGSSNLNIGAIGLGALSIVLFVIGVILLASAAAAPRTRP